VVEVKSGTCLCKFDVADKEQGDTMYDQYTWVFGLSVIVAFFAAFGIGANDVVRSL
jgi:phosphate/sulfate permease